MWRKLKKEAQESGQTSDEKWVGMTSMNSLRDIYSLYCNADLAKVLQPFFYVACTCVVNLYLPSLFEWGSEPTEVGRHS